MPKKAVFERSRRELSLDVSVGVHVLLAVEQSSLESQSRGCAKTPILLYIRKYWAEFSYFSKSWSAAEQTILSLVQKQEEDYLYPWSPLVKNSI